MLRTALALAFFVMAGISSAFAYDTPKDLLEALYYPYTQGQDFDWSKFDEVKLRSKSLNDLFAKDQAETPEGDVGRLDFDPYIDGQDYDIKKLVIHDAVITGDTAKVEVTFSNFDTAEDMFFSLVKEPDGWKIDDVESKNKDYPYSLRAILTAPLETE